jgi:hypothetical protein
MRRSVSNRTDNMGSTISPKDLVAFNYSGEIAVGRVERVDSKVIHIVQIVPKPGHHSQVRGGARCCMRISEGTHRNILRAEKANEHVIF